MYNIKTTNFGGRDFAVPSAYGVKYFKCTAEEFLTLKIQT